MRIHALLFYLLLILFPTQAGKHFWPQWALVHGIRVDYLSPTVFLTDIILLLILFFWFLEKRPSFKFLASKKTTVFVIVLFFFLVSSLLASQPLLSLYKMLKLCEFYLFGFYVSQNVVNRRRLALTIFFLSLGTLWSSLLAWLQFLFQSSLSALYSSTHPLIYLSYQFLGERTFDITTFGIAKASWDGRLVLRPYATFPHPNVLAGFIVVIFVLVITNLRMLTMKSIKLSIIHYPLSIMVALATLFISFSRSAWVVWLLVIGYWLLVKKNKAVFDFFKKKKNFGFLMVFLVLFVIYFLSSVVLHRFATLQTDDFLSVSRRLELNKAALRMAFSSPVFGVGFGNFILRLSDFSQNREMIYWLQPVHNIFLLVAAETGLIGLGIFLWFLFRTYKHLLRKSIINHQSLVLTLSSILALGLFDHYFLTLQQTQLLFALVFGLCWAKIGDG